VLVQNRELKGLVRNVFSTHTIYVEIVAKVISIFFLFVENLQRLYKKHYAKEHMYSSYHGSFYISRRGEIDDIHTAPHTLKKYDGSVMCVYTH
jgi:hypothetical protein